MKLKALLFDMDGTIIDNMRFHDQAWFALLRAHGADFDESTFFRQTAGMKNPDILRMFLGSQLTDEECAQLSVEKESHYRSLYGPSLSLMPGLDELMKECDAAGVKLGVATSAPPENIDFVLDGLDLRRRFGAVVGGDEVANGKPAPDIYLKTADKLGAAPGECVVFEDAPIGIESGHRAAMPVFVVCRSLTHAQAMSLPGVVSAEQDFFAWPLAKAAEIAGLDLG